MAEGHGWSSQVIGSELSQGAALASLLGTEGFLLAAIALAIRIGEPQQRMPRKRPWIGPPLRMAKASAWVMVVLAIGGLAAWSSIFVGGSWDGVGRAITGGALLLAVVAQPILGLALAFGAERG